MIPEHSALLAMLQKAEEKSRLHLEEARMLNAELESFNYSVSHDMRGPLTRISGYSQLLLEDKELNAEQRHHAVKIAEAAGWLNEMLDSLLVLSRVVRAELTHTTVDLSKLSAGILGELQATDRQRTVNQQIEPDLLVEGDERLLRLMMTNLLSNAWKYSSGQTEATIVVGRLPHQHNAFFVRDNGIGFTPKDAERIFRPFTRLKQETIIGGTGVGLATVQRIIQRHGGTIRAEAAPGLGATFIFTLPLPTTAVART